MVTDDWGYIIAGEDTRTNLDGVFAAGDIRTKLIRQVVTAAADGAIAGIIAERYLAALTKPLPAKASQFSSIKPNVGHNRLFGYLGKGYFMGYILQGFTVTAAIFGTSFFTSFQTMFD